MSRCPRIYLVGFPALVFAALVLLLWVLGPGEAHLEQLLRVRLLSMVEKAGIPGHALHVDDVDLDLSTGNLTITNARLEVEPRLKDSLRAGAVHHLFTAEAAHIELRGVAYLRAIFTGKLYMDVFELSGLRCTYWVGGSRQGGATTMPAALPGQTKLVHLLLADTVMVSDAVGRVEDVSDALPDLDLAGLSIKVIGFGLQQRGHRSGIRLQADDAWLTLDSARARLPNGEWITVGQVALDLRAGRAAVHTVLLRSAEVSTGHTEQIAMDSIVVRRLDVRRLLADQGLFLGHACMHGVQLESALDKGLAPVDTVRHPLPPEALLGWRLSVSIDTIAVEGAIRYRERSVRTGAWGEVPFDRVSMLVLGLSNQQRSGHLEARCTATLFDRANVELQYRAAVDGSGVFRVDLTVGSLPLHKLNRVLGPLARMEVRSGHLDSLRLWLDGNDHRAHGGVRMVYHDLLFGPTPGTPPDEAHRQLSSILTYLTNERNGGGLSGADHRKVHVVRDPAKSLPHYIWLVLRKGIFRDVRADVRQRIRTLRRAGRQGR